MLTTDIMEIVNVESGARGKGYGHEAAQLMMHYGTVHHLVSL